MSHLFAHSLLVISFLNVLELICLYTSIAITSTQLNFFNYWYLTHIILFNINGMEMVTYWEWWKRVKFGPTDQLYMHKPKSVSENESHKIILF